MTEYWKSNAKKFCDVCKCWIADRQVSIQSHENGKRHKENVAKKIKELVKKSTKEHKDKKKLDEEMKKMEEEALKSYLKDVQVNPDYSSQFVSKDGIELEVDEIEDEEEVTENSGEPAPKKKTVIKMNLPVVENLPEPNPWYELKSDAGHHYYWNTVTNESVWEAPKEGFVSLAEQKSGVERQKRVADEAVKEKNDEIRAAIEREKMRDKYKERIEKNRREEEEAERERVEVMSMGPEPKKDPYGPWTTVVERPRSEFTLDLPEREEKPQPTISISSEPRVRIKNKVLDRSKLGDISAPVSFKKRKFGQKGNMRQRFDEDE